MWTAGASARVRTPGRPHGPLARGVRTGLQQLLPTLSARAAAERSLSCQRRPLIARGGHPHPDPWIQLLQLERVAGSGEGRLCAHACALPRPGGGPRGGEGCVCVWRKAFD